MQIYSTCSDVANSGNSPAHLAARGRRGRWLGCCLARTFTNVSSLAGAMGAMDAIITLVLFGCFGVYVIMGVALSAMGIYYMSDEGAVTMGSTGTVLLLVGLTMLVVGGLAIFANLKKIWLLLLVIEMFNIVLFLVR